MTDTTNIEVADYGLKINNDTPLDEIKRELSVTQVTEERLPYIIGDILVHLEQSGDVAKRKFYKQYLSESKSRPALHSYFTVAKEFNHNDRAKFKGLTFTHFRESLAITKDKKQAVGLLGIAQAENLSVSQMRAVFRRTVSAAQTEPGIDVSPVVELVRLASELGRKIGATELTLEESALLLKELKPVSIWIDNYISRLE